jgi:crotonobetainyl-CoA:carnitine CoA-transferase CaiB-like acyl-CoA transferase
MESLFRDLRVLDMSTVLAGPSVGSFFAELGATVIKIENPRTQGDVTRGWKLNNEDSNAPVSAYFSSINFGKTYRWLDLSNQEHRTEVNDLIRTSDIVLVNFKEGDDVKFGLTSEAIHAIQPSAIYASLRGFASQSERIAYDVVLQAECGFMFMNGNESSGPLKMPVAMIDVIAAHQLKEGILCALIERMRSGKGSCVRVTLEEAALTALVNQASNFLMTGAIAQRVGSLHPNIAPYGETFRCSDDKELVLAVGSNSQFLLLCEMLNLRELEKDERFSMNQHRVTNRLLLARELQSAFATNTRDYWMDKFIAHGIPAGAIRSMDEVMSRGTAQRMIRNETMDGIQTSRISSVAFKLES